MAKTKKTYPSLQVGEATEETSPVAAVIEMNGIFGKQLFHLEGEEASDIIFQIDRFQDLHCLCRMAPAMGTKEDANVAVALEEFLASDYEIEDFDRFDFPFSIGNIKCIAWAVGENNCQILRKLKNK